MEEHLGQRGGRERADGQGRRCTGQGEGRTHLHAELVPLEELPAGVPGALALEKLLGEPAVEALVVLPLQLGARLAYAVHGGGRPPARALSPRRAGGAAAVTSFRRGEMTRRGAAVARGCGRCAWPGGCGGRSRQGGPR